MSCKTLSACIPKTFTLKGLLEKSKKALATYIFFTKYLQQVISFVFARSFDKGTLIYIFKFDTHQFVSVKQIINYSKELNMEKHYKI